MELETLLKKNGLNELYSSLSESEKGSLSLLLNPYPLLWAPQPGPQSEAYFCQADELFYGGRAGGGKTDLLLGLAATAHRKTLILRRETTQARDIIGRSTELLYHCGKFNGQTGIWRDLPGDRLIEISGCEHEDSKQKFKGRPHDLKAFDEVCDFTESQFIFISAWNRTTAPGQRCRIVCTGNPPSHTDGEWVLRRWAPWLDGQYANPAKPGELRWYAMVDGDEVEREDGAAFQWKAELIKPRSRTFIPASLKDNRYLANGDYERTLQNLPEPLRSQLLYGDFSVGRDDDPWQLIPTEWVRLAQARWDRQPQPTLALSAVGLDVARGGKDKTVIAKRYGNWYAPLKKYPGVQTPDGPAAATVGLIELAGTAKLLIDSIGIGASAYDSAKASIGSRAEAVNFGAGSDQTDRTGKFGFLNLRAEAYWKLREALDPDLGDDLALPPDPELFSDLCTAQWELRSGRIKVEDKDAIKKRLGRSPDCGDALVLASMQRPEADIF